MLFLNLAETDAWAWNSGLMTFVPQLGRNCCVLFSLFKVPPKSCQLAPDFSSLLWLSLWHPGTVVGALQLLRALLVSLHFFSTLMPPLHGSSNFFFLFNITIGIFLSFNFIVFNCANVCMYVYECRCL